MTEIAQKLRHNGAWIDWESKHARHWAPLDERDRHEAAAEIERLTLENWQLKGALGYPVPGHIPCGDFKCGLCEARALNGETEPK
jgi:hypothetical protein